MPKNVFTSNLYSVEKEAYIPDFVSAKWDRSIAGMLPGDIAYIFTGSLACSPERDLYIDTNDTLGVEPENMPSLATRIGIMRVNNSEHNGYITDMRRVVSNAGIQYFDEEVLFQEHVEAGRSQRLLLAIFTDFDGNVFGAGDVSLADQADYLMAHTDRVAQDLEAVMQEATKSNSSLVVPVFSDKQVY